jgi:ATP-dependent Clp protease ATP-binding subunit ClpC
LNRLTEIVIFRSLAKESMSSIVDLELNKVSQRLKDKKLKIEVSDEAKEFLIEKGYDEKLGARPLRRAVEKYLEDTLAEELLSGNIRKNKPITVILSDDEEKGLCFDQKKSGKDKVSVSSTSSEDEPEEEKS